MHPQTLPDAEIEHDFLTATRDCVGTDVAVQPLDFTALSAAAVAQTAKDLACLARAELEGGGRLRLEAGNRTAQLEHCLCLVHRLRLKDDILQPVVRGLDLAGHVRQLHPNDRMVNESLAKSAALVGIFDGLFVANARESKALDDNAQALVVEVHHDDCNRQERTYLSALN